MEGTPARGFTLRVMQGHRASAYGGSGVALVTGVGWRPQCRAQTLPQGLVTTALPALSLAPCPAPRYLKFSGQHGPRGPPSILWSWFSLGAHSSPEPLTGARHRWFPVGGIRHVGRRCRPLRGLTSYPAPALWGLRSDARCWAEPSLPGAQSQPQAHPACWTFQTSSCRPIMSGCLPSNP